MRFSIFATLLAAVSATTSSSELPTFTSTIVSSTCSSSSSKAYYGNYTSLEVDSYLYETDYFTNQNTLTMLQTACSNDECYVTTILNTLSTVTATVDGILTTYVTAAPFTVIYNDHTTSTLATQTPKASVPSASITKTSYFASETGSFVQKSKISSVVSGTISTPEYSGYASTLPFVSEADEDSTLAETVTIPHTTVLTVTTCSNHKCQATSVTTGITVVTTTVNGVKTVYTTYCPLSGEAKTTAFSTTLPHSAVNAKTTVSSTVTTPTSASAAASSKFTPVVSTKTTDGTEPSSTQTKTDTKSTGTTYQPEPSASTSTNVQTTVVTVTSCHKNKCSSTPVTTGVSYITSTVSGTETVFTTYCPLTGQLASSSVANTPVTTLNSKTPQAFTSAPVTASSTTSFSIKNSISSAASESTVNVITNNIITQSKTVVSKSTGISSTTTGTVPSAVISSYQGGAARLIPGALGLPLVYLLL